MGVIINLARSRDTSSTKKNVSAAIWFLKNHALDSEYATTLFYSSVYFFIIFALVCVCTYVLGLRNFFFFFSPNIVEFLLRARREFLSAAGFFRKLNFPPSNRWLRIEIIHGVDWGAHLDDDLPSRREDEG